MPATTLSGSPSSSRVSILVVEDSDDDLFLIQRAFLYANYNDDLIFVRDGEEAIQYLRNALIDEGTMVPNLILMDINMPRKNGFEALEEIKSDDSLAAIPVVMLSSSSRENDIDNSYKSGASSFITKPVDFAMFKKMAVDFTEYWTAVARVPTPGSSAA